MNIPLSIFDVKKIIDSITDNYPFKLYYLDSDNKSSMFSMIKRKLTSSYQDKDYFMIMYDLDTIGHWVCLVVDYYANTAYFYCSFGVFIDSQFDFSVKPVKDPDLVKGILRYLHKRGFEVHYNNKQMQDVDSSICGRYCALFLCYNINDSFTPDEFNDYIIYQSEKYHVTPDEIVLSLTDQ